MKTYFSDSEYRILLAALERERKLYKWTEVEEVINALIIRGEY